MNGSESRAAVVREAERRIAWVLENPLTSTWLKDALESATRRDPVDVMNDLELLDHLLKEWTRAKIEVQL